MKQLRVYEINSTSDRKTYSTNTSDLVSEVLRLTAHYCDWFLSDILYVINDFNKAVENGEPFDQVLLFHESGVHFRDREDLEKFMEYHGESQKDRAFFELKYDPESGEQMLQKLNVYFVNL